MYAFAHSRRVRTRLPTRCALAHGSRTEAARAALEELFTDAERVRKFVLPATSSQAYLRRARERNMMGKACADGVAFLRFAECVLSDAQVLAL